MNIITIMIIIIIISIMIIIIIMMIITNRFSGKDKGGPSKGGFLNNRLFS